MATTTTIKRTIRRKVPTEKSPDAAESFMDSVLSPAALIDLSDQLIRETQSIRASCEQLQRAMEETKLAWKKEQEQHKRETSERIQQEAIIRQREEETYQYE